MKVFIVILMFLVTIFAANSIAENGRVVKVGMTTATRHLTSVGCIAIALTAVAFNAACVYLLACVV